MEEKLTAQTVSTKNAKQRTSNGTPQISKSVELQIFEDACLNLIKAGFPVQVSCASNDHGLLVQGIILKVNCASWCRECKHLKAFEEMTKPGLCQHCSEANP